MPYAPRPPYDRLLLAAESVVRARPEADPQLVRDVFAEVARTVDDGLALDGLDEHDTAAVVDALCVDLVAEDPGAAVRGRAFGAEVHEPEVAAAAYAIVGRLLQL
jgi:hypothetical protein